MIARARLEKIGWGMIGCGNVTEVKSAPAFDQVPGSRLVAVMSRTEERVRDYAARHRIPKWYVDARRLIDDPEVNAVYVATPPSSHAEYALLAAAAGKPVYVEKPMACRYTECLRMIEACDGAGVPLFVAYYRRCLPRFLKIKELVDQGAIGQVRLVSISFWLSPRPDDCGRVAGARPLPQHRAHRRPHQSRPGKPLHPGRLNTADHSWLACGPAADDNPARAD